MVLTLADTPFEAVKLGPEQWFRLTDDGQLTMPGHRVAAHYADGHWIVGGHRFKTVKCEGPVRCRFESREIRGDEVHGPYDHILLVYGVLWAGARSIAHFHDDTHEWISALTGNRFGSVVLSESGSFPKRRIDFIRRLGDE